MTGSKAPKKTRLRGLKKPPERFESPYAEQLTELYKAEKFKGRPPENSVVLLGRLIKAGHFPWLNVPSPEWAIAIADGGPGHQQYLADQRDALDLLKRHYLEEANKPFASTTPNVPGASKHAGGIQSGIKRREKAKAESEAIVFAYQTATKSANKKPDAFVVAKWHIQHKTPDLQLSEQRRQIKNLTKRLRESDSAI